MTAERHRLVERLYGILDELHDQCGGYRYLSNCDSRIGWPARGVYFFFDHREPRTRTRRPRVVRVGTHALSDRSRTTLWAQHRGPLAGKHPGGGNHRGSIVRLHVGAALLAMGAYPEQIHATWGRGSTAPREVREAEYTLERDVSAYVGTLPLLWLAVDDPPGPESQRATIEQGAVGALSNRGRPAINPPSPSWLGHHSHRPAVRESGLWNINHVDEIPTAMFLEIVQRRLSP